MTRGQETSAHFMPGVGPLLWRGAFLRAYPQLGKRTIVYPPVPRTWAKPSNKAAMHYYKMLDRVNLGFRP